MNHLEAHELADYWELRAGLLDADPADASISACLRECAAALRSIAIQAPTPGAEVLDDWSPVLTPLDEWVDNLLDGFSMLIRAAEHRGELRGGALEKSMRDSFAALYRVLIGKLQKSQAPAVAHGWQPIETAPKDGSLVLTWREHTTRPLITRWDWVYGEWENDDSGFHVHNITHWMPLPSAPGFDVPVQGSQP